MLGRGDDLPVPFLTLHSAITTVSHTMTLMKNGRVRLTYIFGVGLYDGGMGWIFLKPRRTIGTGGT